MRLFVAVVPPPPVRSVIAGLERPEVDGLRWTVEDQWHLTLRFLGELDSVDPVIGAVREAAGRARPVEARLGTETVRVGEVLAVDVAGVEELARAVVGATEELGRTPPRRPFRGHITLARTRRRHRVPAQVVGLAVPGGGGMSWSVEEVHVIRSHLGPTVLYESLALVPLTGSS